MSDPLESMEKTLHKMIDLYEKTRPEYQSRIVCSSCGYEGVN